MLHRLATKEPPAAESMSMTTHSETDRAIARTIGERLQQHRLAKDLTQKELAEQSGVSRRTVINAENGERTTLATLISIMRALGLLDHIDRLIPEPVASPLEIVKQNRRTKKRASGKRGAESGPATGAGESDWEWDE